MNIRKLAASTLGALCIAAFATAANAFPDRPVKVIVGYPPGGTLDGPARIFLLELARLAGQPFIVENRPGASSNIASEHVSRAAPDGYTLLLSSSSLSSSGALYKKLSFNPQTDFRHIGGFCSLPTVIVARKDLPVDTLQDAIDLARKSPGKLTYGSPGNGTGAHIAGEVLKRHAGVQIMHVPFKGAAQALTDITGGHIDFMIAGLATLEGSIRNKQVKVLAVTNAEPSRELVDAPTIAQALRDVTIPREYQFETWLGLSAPAGTPEAVVQRLQALMQEALKTPKVRQSLIGGGVTPAYTSGAQLQQRIDREIPAYARIVKEIGVSLN